MAQDRRRGAGGRDGKARLLRGLSGPSSGKQKAGISPGLRVVAPRLGQPFFGGVEGQDLISVS